MQSKSDTCSYSVLDWATYGVSEGVATSNEVVEYLEEEFAEKDRHSNEALIS